MNNITDVNPWIFGAVIGIGMVIFFKATGCVYVPKSISNQEYMDSCDVCVKRGYKCIGEMDPYYPSVIRGVVCRK